MELVSLYNDDFCSKLHRTVEMIRAAATKEPRPGTITKGSLTNSSYFVIYYAATTATTANTTANNYYRE